MTTTDSLYLPLIAILLLLDYFMLWPMFLRRAQVDPGRARTWLWSTWMIELWTLVAAGVALWLFEDTILGGTQTSQDSGVASVGLKRSGINARNN